MSYSDVILFGEVLYDCFPDGNQVLGGAPFNVAWHCQAFGLEPVFISRLGNDAQGEEILAAMQTWGMRTDGVQIDTTYATGKVDVSIENGEPAYDIVENSAWDFIDSSKLPAISKNSILYHGSLISRSIVSANCLQTLRSHAEVGAVFVDVNLRSPWWQRSQLELLVQGCRWIKLNRDELALLVPDEELMLSQAQKLMTCCGAELLIVTQGEKGASIISLNDVYEVEPNRTDRIVDTVGAGDAFCSVLLLGLHMGWSIENILQRAQQFASQVVQIQGATTKDREFYQPFMKEWNLE